MNAPIPKIKQHKSKGLRIAIQENGNVAVLFVFFSDFLEELGIFDGIQQVLTYGKIILATNIKLNHIIWLQRFDLIDFFFECRCFLEISYDFKHIV